MAYQGWGERAGSAFETAFNAGNELAYKKWKDQQDNSPEAITAKSKALMQGYLEAQKASGLGVDPSADGFGTVMTGMYGGKPRYTTDDPIRQYERASVLRKEFIDRPEVKEYVAINTQVKSMDALLKNAKSGDIKNRVALDQALITMFNKLTDPTSVVRESEYARTPQNLPVVNRFIGAMEKINQGGAGLTNSDREALVWGAKVIADERGGTFSETLKSYEDLAKNQARVDPTNVLRGFEPHKSHFGKTEDKYGFSNKSDDELNKRLAELSGKK